VFWGPYSREPVTMKRMGEYFEATVHLPKGSLVRYQYSVPGYDYEHREQFAKNYEVNRAVLADSDKTVNDAPYSFGYAGVPRPAVLEGRVTDSGGQPVLDAVVLADGIVTMTLDGYYRVGVRDRDLEVLTFTLDGRYRAHSITTRPGKLDVELESAPTARVTINTTADMPAHHKLRVYGTAEQFGAKLLMVNRFLDENYLTVEGPMHLELHEGQWVEYMYTVGNPVISYENKDGHWAVRGFVARDGLTLNDTIGSFTSTDSVTLNVRVPDYTEGPVGVEGIHPTPLHMHDRGNGEWTLVISNYQGAGREYEYYKAFAGAGREGVIRRVHSPVMNDVVTIWFNEDAEVASQQFDVQPVSNRFRIFGYPADFYSNIHAAFLDRQVRRFAELGYHGLNLTQVWGYESLDPPTISRSEPMTLYMPEYELTKWTRLAHSLGLEVMIEPQMGGAEHLLAKGQEFDKSWWRAWLEEIERFNIHMARAAEAAGVDYLQLKAKEPGFLLPAEFVDDYNAGLRAIVDKMRLHFSGKIIAAYEEWVQGVDYHGHGDQIVQVSYNLGLETRDPTQAQVDAAVERLFEDRYRVQYEKSGNPLWIKIAYQSVDGAASGAFAPESEGPHTLENHNYPLDLDEQRMIYEAFYKAASTRPWVAGFALFGYGFTDVPLSRDVTLNGKPAEHLSSAWAKALSGR